MVGRTPKPSAGCGPQGSWGSEGNLQVSQCWACRGLIPTAVILQPRGHGAEQGASGVTYRHERGGEGGLYPTWWEQLCVWSVVGERSGSQGLLALGGLCLRCSPEQQVRPRSQPQDQPSKGEGSHSHLLTGRVEAWLPGDGRWLCGGLWLATRLP